MNPTKIKTEVVEVGLITLYFFACFVIFMTLKTLSLYQYHINFYGWASALIGALVIGKTVFIIDKTSLHKWLKHLRPINEIILKAMVYTLVIFLVVLLEKSFHYWSEDIRLRSWSAYVFGQRKGAMMLAHMIYIYLCFVAFYFMHFLNEAFGRQKIVELLTKPR